MNFPKKFPTLSSERLSYVPFEHEDAKRLYYFHSKKEHFPHANLKVFRTELEAVKRIDFWNRGFQNKEMIVWAIKQGTETVGMISLWNFDDTIARCEVGFHIYPEHRGQDYMKEAMVEIRNYALKDLGIDDLMAYTAPDNKATKAILEFANFRYQGDIDDVWLNDSAPPQMSVYRIRAYEV